MLHPCQKLREILRFLSILFLLILLNRLCLRCIKYHLSEIEWLVTEAFTEKNLPGTLQRIIFGIAWSGQWEFTQCKASQTCEVLRVSPCAGSSQVCGGGNRLRIKK